MTARHRRVRRHGWRCWYLFTPRLLPWWRFNLHLQLFPSWFLLGIWAGTDEDGDFEIQLAGVVAILTIRPQRMWSRRERARKRDEYLAEYGPQLVADAERFLGQT